MIFNNPFKQDEDTYLIKRFKPEIHLNTMKASLLTREALKEKFIVCAVVDSETTSMEPTGEVMDFGIRLVLASKADYSFRAITDITYESLNDVSVQTIIPEVTKVTGIDKSMLVGHSADLSKVDSLLEFSDVVIAHNASFDKYYFEKHLKKNYPWACSFKDVNWRSYEGIGASSLPALLSCYGYFHEAHRALPDVDALCYVLSQQDHLQSLLKEHFSTQLRLNLRGLKPFHNAFLKTQKFWWNAEEKCHSRDFRIYPDSSDAERILSSMDETKEFVEKSLNLTINSDVSEIPRIKKHRSLHAN